MVKCLRLDRVDRALGVGFVAQRQLFQLLAVQLDQPGGKLPAWRATVGIDAPIFLRP